MKVVLDTNVVVSGVFFGGAPEQVLEAWRDGRLELVVSPEVFEEYVRVGDRLADQFPEVDLEPFLNLVAVAATLVVPEPPPESVSADRDDDKFLACAVSGGAECIVTGDRDLLEIRRYRGVEVLRPRPLLDRLSRSVGDEKQ